MTKQAFLIKRACCVIIMPHVVRADSALMNYHKATKGQTKGIR